MANMLKEHGLGQSPGPKTITFDIKHDLMIELFEYLQGQAAEELTAAANEDDPADGVVALLSILLRADPTEPGTLASTEETIETLVAEWLRA